MVSADFLQCWPPQSFRRSGQTSTAWFSCICLLLLLLFLVGLNAFAVAVAIAGGGAAAIVFVIAVVDACRFCIRSCWCATAVVAMTLLLLPLSSALYSP